MIDILDGKLLYDKVDGMRKERGWTIYELAKNAAVSPVTIYNWRDRHSLPTLALLEAICAAFRITVVDFLTDDEERAVLNEEQRELVRLWNGLTAPKKKVLLDLMKTLNS